MFTRALKLSGIDTTAPLHIADIGCGTGVASMALAKATQASITAVDFMPAFLEELKQRASRSGLQEHITALEADMSDLPFDREQFDVIWSEGAIYNIGFERGITEWREYLKPGGILVVTEITWLHTRIPEELRTFWESEYAEIALASTKIQQLESSGYTPSAYFMLPPECWLDEYYAPLTTRFDAFLEEHEHSEKAQAVVEAEQEEIALYKKSKVHYSYGCYIARKVPLG